MLTLKRLLMIAILTFSMTSTFVPLPTFANSDIGSPGAGSGDHDDDDLGEDDDENELPCVGCPVQDP
ncbi:hypothetical protein KFU94_33885 [Chloroflexi bacterium TSY]|nr:hypothetical protein [Chloroflexi bacterium TSY]